ncbi:hypothetical protein KIN20_024882 [Parelaphostrongylus tenuis]|uniref:Uncharacterized protein n=1 Tax=Parelaphostrongylus tenuis TaxID=148309 RepID=A0AAD5MU61_PARTN|nr:hypothetical protein KIN20_024882 [Parelaphostrongylus tenuis]
MRPFPKGCNYPTNVELHDLREADNLHLYLLKCAKMRNEKIMKREEQRNHPYPKRTRPEHSKRLRSVLNKLDSSLASCQNAVFSQQAQPTKQRHSKQET